MARARQPVTLVKALAGALFVSIVTFVVGIVILVAWVSRNASDQRAATCGLVRAQLAAYEETPPTTETGRALREAWRAEERQVCR